MSYEQLENRVQTVLRESEQHIPPELNHRIANVRRKALMSEPKSRTSRLLWPAFTAVAVSVALVAVLVVPNYIGSHAKDAEADEYIVNVDADLYEELEFYQWLAENEAGTDNRG